MVFAEMKKIAERILFRGRWLTLKENICRTAEGREIRWECVERRNSRAVVVIVPRLVPSGRYAIIKQFRPALNGYIIGFPAGVAQTDDIAFEALKELREETGYIGTKVHLSPPLKFNPGTINDTVYVANVDIDENAPENISPKQELESCEDIVVFAKTPDEIRIFLNEEISKGTAVGGGLWYTFFGLTNIPRQETAAK